MYFDLFFLKILNYIIGELIMLCDEINFFIVVVNLKIK